MAKIEHAIHDFQDIVHIRLRVSGEDYICIFDSFKVDKERTVREFENYLIGLMNQHGEVN